MKMMGRAWGCCAGGAQAQYSELNQRAAEARDLMFVPRPKQAEVLAYRRGAMGVAAVPGSGKTATLSFLTAQLLAETQLADGQEILIVTLVNSAVATSRAGQRIRPGRWLAARLWLSRAYPAQPGQRHRAPETDSGGPGRAIQHRRRAREQ